MRRDHYRLDCRLSALFRTGALLRDDSSLKMELLANLLYLYDANWSLEQEGARVVVGHAYHVMQQLPEDMKKPAIVRKIRKWLTLTELGHLLGEGPNIVESRKFGRLVFNILNCPLSNIMVISSKENPQYFSPRCVFNFSIVLWTYFSFNIANSEHFNSNFLMILSLCSLGWSLA